MNTPATPIAIVRATIEDVPLIAPLFDGYRQFYKQPANLEGARHFLTERLEENSSVIFLALRTDEKGMSKQPISQSGSRLQARKEAIETSCPVR